MTDLSINPLFQFLSWLEEKINHFRKPKPLTPEQVEEREKIVTMLREKGFHFDLCDIEEYDIHLSPEDDYKGETYSAYPHRHRR